MKLSAVIRRSALLLSALIIVSSVGIAIGQTPKLVDAGGYHLDVVQAGSGNPTVVLVGGLGNDLTAWDRIVPSVAEYSSVVAYSRSGLGRSEMSNLDPTVRGSVTELHNLLSRLKLKPPYVLVGASYGGIIVRLYTSVYPTEVAAVVLSDATSEDQVKRYGKLDSSYPAAFRKSFEDLIKTEKGGEATETRESLRIQEVGSVEGMLPLPDIPIAVLTSMQPKTDAQYVNQTPRGYAEWRAIHDEWFLRSSNAIHIQTSKSGHHIQDDEPQLLIDAIRFVLDRIRTK